MTRSRRSAKRRQPGSSCVPRRQLKSFGVVLVALLVAFPIGCGNGDGGQPSGATAPSRTSASGTTPSGTTAPAGATTAPPPIPNIRGKKDRPERTSTQTVPSKGGEPSGGNGGTRDSRRVERYLRENFRRSGAKGGWYDHVVEVAVSGGTTTVRTDLSGNRAGRSLAKQICLDVRGSIPGLTDIVRVTELAQSSTLARCVP
jgi:hypothetical protein